MKKNKLRYRVTSVPVGTSERAILRHVQTFGWRVTRDAVLEVVSDGCTICIGVRCLDIEHVYVKKVGGPPPPPPASSPDWQRRG